MESALATAIDDGTVTQEDAMTMRKFVGLSGHPSFSIFILAKTGKLDHLQNEPSFQATMHVMNKMGLEDITFNDKTA
jgi:hypothetical protein